jgi:hypothetical protein
MRLVAVDAGRNESGSALILAMVFLLLGSLVVLPLATYANTSNVTSASLQQQRNIDYAAEGLTSGAIQAARYVAGSTSTCPTFPTPVASTIAVKLNGVWMRTTCIFSASAPGQSSATFETGYCSSQTMCASLSPVVTATVLYNFLDSSGNPELGAAAYIQTWTVNSASN